MQIVEFDTNVENGVISIPSQYHELITQSVRVILLPKGEIPSGSNKKRKKLYSLAIDMTGFTFDRNEINER